MRAIKNIDTKEMTVTAQAGVVWEKLDKELAKKGFTLRLYPSSYPAATVGGWLAQGGAGIGSYQAGWFRNNVVSARVVMPNGKIKEFNFNGIDIINGAEGITGFIVDVTMLIMPLEEMTAMAIGSPTAQNLQELTQSIIEKDLPIWSMLFINPRMAEMKNRAPLRTHLDHPVEKHIELPSSYITTIVFRKNDSEKVLPELEKLIKTYNSKILDDSIAQHEWENRFKIMLVKRLGPSLVPAEVVVPLSSLGNVMAEIEGQVIQPVVKEGLIIKKGTNGKPEVVILGFIPSDQRKFNYNFVFGLSLTIMKIAEKHGGRPYSTGIYFAGKANKIMGKKNVEVLKRFKKEEDPNDILNPKKVIDGGLIGKLMNFVSAFEPIVRMIANRVSTKLGERPTEPVKGIPADVAWYAYACSQCGYCVDECDQFYGRGWESQSPRGKWYWLREYMEGREKWNQFMVDTMLVCTTCEICNQRCSASLPIEPSWMKLRGKLIHEDKRMTIPPFEMMTAALTTQGNIWAGYRKKPDQLVPEGIVGKTWTGS